MTATSETFGVVFEENVPITVRDGTVLRANVFRPAAPGAYPALVERTPYGKGGQHGGREAFALAGYVVVSQDSRGRYASDGEWVPFTEEHTGDAEDGYDTVEWAAAQSWCNGKVGAMGVSYCAWMAWELARLRPPHLVAMAARSIPQELTEVDWPGAFKPGRRIRWWLTTMAPDLRRRAGLPPPHTPQEASAIWNDIEHGHWLGLHPWSRVVDYLPPPLARHAADWLAHPNRRAWRLAEAYREVDVPNLDISGWYDHCNGTIHHLAGMQKDARTVEARDGTRLIIGPWSHVSLGRREFSSIDFGPRAQVDTGAWVIRWFDHWLKGDDNGVGTDSAVRYFVMGAGDWTSADTWPPPGAVDTEFFLRGGNGETGARSQSLSERPASAEEPPDSYVYDPVDPVPTLWSTALFTEPPDRRKLEYRQDILSYLTPSLEEDVEIAGEPEMILYASSSAPDTDFFARLVDDDPAGIALEVCYGLVRARHRHSLDAEALLEPGQVTEFRIRLGPTACRFRKGHRIRVELTSSDFPNHDRNHNVGRDDLVDTELVAAEQRVFHTPTHPSRIVLPVMARTESASGAAKTG